MADDPQLAANTRADAINYVKDPGADGLDASQRATLLKVVNAAFPQSGYEGRPNPTAPPPSKDYGIPPSDHFSANAPAPKEGGNLGNVGNAIGDGLAGGLNNIADFFSNNNGSRDKLGEQFLGNLQKEDTTPMGVNWGAGLGAIKGTQDLINSGLSLPADWVNAYEARKEGNLELPKYQLEVPGLEQGISKNHALSAGVGAMAPLAVIEAATGGEATPGILAKIERAETLGKDTAGLNRALDKAKAVSKFAADHPTETAVKGVGKSLGVGALYGAAATPGSFQDRAAGAVNNAAIGAALHVGGKLLGNLGPKGKADLGDIQGEAATETQPAGNEEESPWENSQPLGSSSSSEVPTTQTDPVTGQPVAQPELEEEPPQAPPNTLQARIQQFQQANAPQIEAQKTASQQLAERINQQAHAQLPEAQAQAFRDSNVQQPTQESPGQQAALQQAGVNFDPQAKYQADQANANAEANAQAVQQQQAPALEQLKARAEALKAQQIQDRATELHDRIAGMKEIQSRHLPKSAAVKALESKIIEEEQKLNDNRVSHPDPTERAASQIAHDRLNPKPPEPKLETEEPAQAPMAEPEPVKETLAVEPDADTVNQNLAVLQNGEHQHAVGGNYTDSEGNQVKIVELNPDGLPENHAIVQNGEGKYYVAPLESLKPLEGEINETEGQAERPKGEQPTQGKEETSSGLPAKTQGEETVRLNTNVEVPEAFKKKVGETIPPKEEPPKESTPAEEPKEPELEKEKTLDEISKPADNGSLESLKGEIEAEGKPKAKAAKASKATTPTKPKAVQEPKAETEPEDLREHLLSDEPIKPDQSILNYKELQEHPLFEKAFKNLTPTQADRLSKFGESVKKGYKTISRFYNSLGEKRTGTSSEVNSNHGMSVFKKKTYNADDVGRNVFVNGKSVHIDEVLPGKVEFEDHRSLNSKEGLSKVGDEYTYKSKGVEKKAIVTGVKEPRFIDTNGNVHKISDIDPEIYVHTNNSTTAPSMRLFRQYSADPTIIPEKNYQGTVRHPDNVTPGEVHDPLKSVFDQVINPLLEKKYSGEKWNPKDFKDADGTLIETFSGLPEKFRTRANMDSIYDKLPDELRAYAQETPDKGGPC